MPTYKEALEEALKKTRRIGKEASATRLLLLHFSELSPTELYTMYEEEMSDISYVNFIKGVELYLFDNIPVQQIMGYVYFYGYKFIVNDKVLIPRFETEELVVNVLMLFDEYFHNQEVDVVDIGTGTGCLAITLKKEESDFMNVWATDISVEALDVAKDNASNLDAKVHFLHGNMLEPLEGMKFDILVSNPPYIPQDEQVEDIIYDNEPHVALFGGEDGLKFYREILKGANSILKQRSIIAFEHGFDKAEQLRKIAKEYFSDAKIYTLQDMQQRDRMTFIINQKEW